MADIHVNSDGGDDATGTGSVGNPYATIQKALDVFLKGDLIVVHIGLGYTITADLTKSTQGSLSGSDQPNILMGDAVAGVRPTITLSGSGLTGLNVTSTGWEFRDLDIDCALQTSSTGLAIPAWSAAAGVRVRRFTAAGVVAATQHVAAVDLEITEGTAAATAAVVASSATQGFNLHNADVWGNACPGILCTQGQSYVDCRVYQNVGSSSDGLRGPMFAVAVIGGVFHGNGRDGIRMENYDLATVVRNNVLTNNGGYGLRMTGGQSLPASPRLDYNAYGGGASANTSGARSNLAAGAHDVTLAGDPYADAANGDFAPNAAAGALLRAAGVPGPTPRGATAGFRDIGVQHQDAGGGGGSYQQARVINGTL